MRTKNPKRSRWLLIGCGVAFLVWLAGFITVNQMFPEPEEKNYQLNETLSIGGMEMTFSNYQKMSVKDFRAAHPEVEGYLSPFTEDEQYVVTVELDLTRVDPEQYETDLMTLFILEGPGFASYMEMMELFIPLNPDLQVDLTQLKPGETVHMVVPYLINDLYLTEEMKQEDVFSLVLSIYPTRTTVALTSEPK